MADAEERFEELVRRHARAVRVAIARVGGRAGHRLADDIEQRVFLEVWKQVSREQEIQYPASYIYRATVREAVRLLRAEQHRESRVVAEADEATSQRPPTSDEPSPEAVADARRLGRTVHEVLETLSADRAVAARAHLAGVGVEELMKRRGWSYNKARNLIQRGMADLRQRLNARGIHG